MGGGLGTDEDWDQEFNEQGVEIEIRLDHLDRWIELLAWIYRQKSDPKALNDYSNWPKAWIVDCPVATEIAKRDRLLFDLARHQAAYIIRNVPEDSLLSDEDEAMRWFRIADMLEATRPSTRGKQVGTTAITKIIEKIDGDLWEWNVWGLKEVFAKDRAAFDPGTITTRALSGVIFNRLNGHEILSEHPDAVPSLEALRSIISKIR